MFWDVTDNGYVTEERMREQVLPEIFLAPQLSPASDYRMQGLDDRRLLTPWRRLDAHCCHMAMKHPVPDRVICRPLEKDIHICTLV